MLPSKEEAVAPARAAASPVQPEWMCASICKCPSRGWLVRCCCSRTRRASTGSIVPVGVTAGGGGSSSGGGTRKCGSTDSPAAGSKSSWGSSMFVLQLTGKLKRSNVLRRRGKQQLKTAPKAAIGLLNELAALSSRNLADELYVEELQCARQRRLSLKFCDARFEQKYVGYHHDNWSLRALRERLLKFLGTFVFFAVFEDILSSVRQDSLGKKLVAYAVIVSAFFGCYVLNEVLKWLETPPSAHISTSVQLRLPLHAGFSIVWSFLLMAMAVYFQEIRYFSALLMPLLYGHSILHFRWLRCIYFIVAVVFEFVWIFVLDGWNSELDIATRAHSLHGVLIMAASLFMFVKYVCEQASREHFKLVEVIELRKQQSVRGNALAQKLIANILPAFIIPQLRAHPSLFEKHLSADRANDPSHASYRPPERDQVIAHSYNSISVLFATVLVGTTDEPTTSGSSTTRFTESAQLERVLLLDEVFSVFDRLLDLPSLPQRPGYDINTTSTARNRCGLSPPSPMRTGGTVKTVPADSSMYEKIKTIGNTYMVAAGIPHEHDCARSNVVPVLSLHAEAAVALSCKMQEAVASLNTSPERQKTAPNGSKVMLRIGIHSGAVTAGVIGIKKYCFDIWGDTVNVASRMDATGIPGRIQVSAASRRMLSGTTTAMALDGTSSVEFEPRGHVLVKGKGLMETFLVSQTTRSQVHEAKKHLLSCRSSSCVVDATPKSSDKGKTSGSTALSVQPSQFQVPLQPFSLTFKTSAVETTFREEYSKVNLQVANASLVLVILFLLSLVCLTGCWFWFYFFAAELRWQSLQNDGSATAAEDDNERKMQLAWLIVVGNTLIAVTMVVQLQCSTRTHHMQRRLVSFSVVAILIVFAMNVSADHIGYSQLLETPYVLSGLIYVFFLSKLLVARAATICWTWLLVHTVYRYSTTGLHSLFYSQLGSPLFLCAMTMMLHVLASDNERKVRQGHWLRNMASAQSYRLREARASSDALLENCLPKSVISDALLSAEGASSAIVHQNARGVEHRSFEVHHEVTVLFVDIVNFTKLSAGMKPADLVSLLHDLISQIDQLVERYPVEKIKTIGDAYMVASGLPECRDDHAEAIAEFALDLLDIVSRFNTSNQNAPHLHRPPIAVRAGIHTGPAIAGIVGDKKFCYDVWGAGVDGAVAMEQDGVANRIHLSQSTANRLGSLYHMQPRKPVVQAKPAKTADEATSGGVQTYFLIGRSKRVDFTRHSSINMHENAKFDGGVATPSLRGEDDTVHSTRATSCSPINEVEPRSQRPSVRVERERRQSSTW